jgi:hypothetical protein
MFVLSNSQKMNKYVRNFLMNHKYIFTKGKQISKFNFTKILGSIIILALDSEKELKV